MGDSIMMKLKILGTAAALISTFSVIPVQAESPNRVESGTPTAQANPTREQVIQACTQKQAETLPTPFTDVPPDHWAFKPVMSMHFCGPGPFRATTPAQSQTPLNGSKAER